MMWTGDCSKVTYHCSSRHRERESAKNLTWDTLWTLSTWCSVSMIPSLSRFHFRKSSKRRNGEFPVNYRIFRRGSKKWRGVYREGNVATSTVFLNDRIFWQEKGNLDIYIFPWKLKPLALWHEDVCSVRSDRIPGVNIVGCPEMVLFFLRCIGFKFIVENTQQNR